MCRKIAYVVGNAFSGFAKHEGVYTFSDFVEKSFKNKLASTLNELILGQGLSEEESKVLTLIAKNHGVKSVRGQRDDIATGALTHKHRSENIMISDPVEQNRNLYFSELYINDSCSEMSDHTTGQHIQGMVLTEAARQMMLAVGEKYILKDHERGNFYCALLKVSSQFFEFGFPIETYVLHHVNEITEKLGRYKVSTITEFVQNGKVISAVDIAYVFNDKKYLLNKETEMAEESLRINKEIHLERTRLLMTA